MLKTIMLENGFEIYSHEWWHYNLIGWEQFDILDIDFNELDICKSDDARLSFQNKTLEQVSYKHIMDSGVNSESVVANIGCGNGDIVCFLLDKVRKIYAIDASEEQLDLTKTKVDAIINSNSGKLADVEYIRVDIRNNNNLLLGKLDMVFMRFVLIHNEINQHQNIISNIKQMLKPGGIIVNEETAL